MNKGDRFYGVLSRYFAFAGGFRPVIGTNYTCYEPTVTENSFFPDENIHRDWFSRQKSYLLVVEKVRHDILWYSSYAVSPQGQLRNLRDDNQLKQARMDSLLSEIIIGALEKSES